MRPRASIGLFLVAPIFLASPQSARPVKFAVLSVTVNNDVTRPSTQVIRTGEEWKDFLKKNAALASPLPRIDFTRQTVAAIFAGSKPTGGYSLRVDKIVDVSQPNAPTRAVVHYRLLSPPPDSIVPKPSPILISSSASRRSSTRSSSDRPFETPPPPSLTMELTA